MADMSKLQDMAMGTDLSQEAISKAKQSKSERKARKTMQKLGLKHIEGNSLFCPHMFDVWQENSKEYLYLHQTLR